MANFLGIRSLYHQLRRKFREPRDFDVRYWSVRELLTTFEKAIGDTSISIDCFFGLGLQMSDREFMPPIPRLAVMLSEVLRKSSGKIGALRYLADSVYVTSIYRSEPEKQLL
jgi:hypothetical protein